MVKVTDVTGLGLGGVASLFKLTSGQQRRLRGPGSSATSAQNLLDSAGLS